MKTQIKVKSHTQSNGWFNIKTEDGKEISVMAEKNPKLKALLEANPDGNFVMECDTFQGKKDPNKTYASDVKEGGGFGGGGWKGAASRGGNESYALAYSKDVWVAHIEKGLPFTSDNCIQLADKFYSWLESKKPKA